MKNAVVGFGVMVFLFQLTGLLFGSAPTHARVLFDNPLTRSFENDYAVIENRNGAFVDDGWQSTQHGFTDGSKLVIHIKNRLPQTGTIEWDVRNFDPYVQTDFSKQHVAFISNTLDQDDMFYNGGSWVYLRTGQAYRNDDGSCSMKFDVGARGLDSRVEEHMLSNKFWNAKESYHFKLVYDASHIWFYLNGELIKSEAFSGQQKRFNQISLGGDDEYPSIVGPIFSNLKISTDESETFFLDQTRTKNLVGLDAPDFGGHGITVGDVNGDGLPDMYIGDCVQGACLRDILYIQQPDGTFADETSIRGVTDECCSHAVIFFDADNDGDLDLFNANTWAPNRLYINDGAGYFSEESIVRGIEEIDGETRGAVVFDVNNDGWLDIYAVNWGMKNEMYINDGTGRFTREYRGAEGAVEDPEVVGTQGVTVADIENDGDYDIYVSKREKENELYVNDNGFFTEAAAAHGVAVSKRTDGATFADFDNDGDMDLFVSNTQQPHSSAPMKQIILVNDGAGHFIDKTSDYNLSHEGFSTQLFDADNDGILDLFRLTNIGDGAPQVTVLSLGDGQGGFQSAGYNGAAVYAADARAVAAADMDNDGDVDLFYTAKLFENSYLENRSEVMGNFVQISLYGAAGDVGGVGGKVDVYEAGHSGQPNYLLGHHEVTTAVGYLCNSGLIQHFGLGDRTSCDVRVTQIDGSIVERTNVTANQRIVIGESRQHVYHLAVSGGDGQSGTVGQVLPQDVVVRVADETNAAAANIDVTFTARNGGLVNGAPTTTVSSDAQGLARVSWRLGHQTGNQLLRAGVNADSLFFSAVAQAAAPHTIIKISGDGQPLTPGTPFPQLFSAAIQDEFGNAVPATPVQFQVTAGNGSMGGLKQQTVVTDANGNASVAWTPDVYLGPQNALQASASFNAAPLVNSPVQWSYAAADIDGVASTVTATSPIPADGVATSQVTATLKTSNGQLAGPGFSVAFQASGDGVVVSRPDSLTDAGGQVRAWISRTNAGTTVVKATVLGLNLDLMQQPSIEFQAAHAPAAHIVLVSGNEQSGVVGRPLAAPFVVRVLDETQQPVPNHKVTFSLISGGGAFAGNDSAIIFTNVDGLAVAQLTLATKANVASIIQARADSVVDPVFFRAHSLPDAPATMRIMSGDGQNGAPHSTLPQRLAVSIKDQYANAVANVPVLFRVSSGDCSVNGSTQATVSSDSLGAAGVAVVLGDPGESVIQANADSLSATFHVTATSQTPDVDLSTLSATSPIEADGQAASSLVATIVDQGGQPLQGVTVLFEISGDDVTLAQPDSLSNEQGKVFAALSSTTAGEKTVSARLLPQNVLLAKTATVLFRRTETQIAVMSGDRQTGVVGAQSAAPLVVRLSNGETPQAGVPVLFTIAAGGGSFHGDDSVMVVADGEGVASTAFTFGTVAGENVIVAAPRNSSAFVTFKLTAHADSAALLLVHDGDHQTASVNSRVAKELVVLVQDKYGNAVAGESVLFSAVDGGQVLTPQPVFSDSLGFAKTAVQLGDRIGEYPYRAELSNGVFVLFQTTAVLSNTAPEIVSFLPAENRIEYQYGERLHFEIVEALDENGDSLTYFWRFNNHLVSESSVLDLYMSEAFPPVDTMRCNVSDGLDSAVVKWTLVYNPASGVSLNSFYAEAAPAGVRLTWAPATTADIIGFLVLRAESEKGDYKRITDDVIKPKTNGRLSFQFNDSKAVQPGLYYYKLRLLLTSGGTQEFGPVSVEVYTPQQLALFQNYPNPFNPTTVIGFELPKADDVRLDVFDRNGRLVSRLLDRRLTAGSHSIVWDACDDAGRKVSSGIYFYKMTTSGQSLTKKLTLMK